MNASEFDVSIKSPINIALIKYWGKRDESLNLPLNDSVSVTLEGIDSQLITTTSAKFDKALKCDTMSLNSDSVSIDRSRKVIDAVRKIALSRNHPEAKTPIRIASTNSVPTGSGLASSASGFSALAAALNQLFSLGLSPTDLSIIARIGSGSACRSIYGGLVKWNAGSLADGSDSFAVQLFDENHWPELRVIVCVEERKEKPVSSRLGMKRSAETSLLLRKRLEDLPSRSALLIEAYSRKDFAGFAKLIMIDSNQFHAICLDTYPPLHYLSDASFRLIDAVHLWNSQCEYIAGYSFDAGPHAILFTLDRHVPNIKRQLSFLNGFEEYIVAKVGKGTIS